MSSSSERGCLWLLLIVLLMPWIFFTVLPILLSSFVTIFGVGVGVLGVLTIVPFALVEYLSVGWIGLLIVSLIVAVFLPVVFAIIQFIRLLRGSGLSSLSTWLIVLLVWILSLGAIVASIAKVLNEAGGIEVLQNQFAL